MASGLGTVLPYALIPAAATTAGGAVASLRVPGPRVGSAIERFAAGVILAAVVAELLPDALRARAPLALAGGFALGVALALGVEQLTRLLTREQVAAHGGAALGDRAEDGPAGLIAVSGVDTLIDGALLGIGFAVGAKQGTLLALALTIETLSLGLSSAAALGQVGAGRGRIVATAAGLSLLFVVGAVAGTLAFGGVRGTGLTVLLAFGSAVLLYLVTEELLVEAREAPQTLWATMLFFAGFVALLLIDMGA